MGKCDHVVERARVLRRISNPCYTDIKSRAFFRTELISSPVWVLLLGIELALHNRSLADKGVSDGQTFDAQKSRHLFSSRAFRHHSKFRDPVVANFKFYEL